MTDSSIVKPAILIDLKKDRIRIHRNTLRSIGNPENVLLLVNPEERTLAILRCDHTDPSAHRIAKSSLEDKKTVELYSRSLINSLRSVCNDWQDSKTYRLYGVIVPQEGMARFHMCMDVSVDGDEL